MKTGETIVLTVDRMSFGPAAVGRVPNPDDANDKRQLVIFVDGALPGEQVEAKLRKQHKNYWEADLAKVLKPSKDRVTPPCPVFDRCGGCQWQHLSYPAQLKAKEEILVHQLVRATGLSQEDLKSKLTVHGAKSEYGYRARLQAHGNRGGIGFYSQGSHSIVHTDVCPVAHPDIQKSWSQFVETRPLDVLAKATGQFKIEWTRTETGQIKEAINSKHAAHGFTQVNPEQNQTLIKIVGELAKPPKSQGKPELLLDLYGGDGNLSKDLQEYFEHTISVDTDNSGEDPAKVEALPKGRTFIKESVEDFLANKHWNEWGFKNVDCVIVDPPRNGLREEARRLLDLRSSRMILVSCDPSTLARDLTTLTANYVVDSLHLIDMFPQTFHMETVVHISRRD